MIVVFVSVKLIKGHEYVYIVENRRHAGRVVQRIVQYIGRADSETIRKLRERYARADRNCAVRICEPVGDLHS